MTTATLDIVPPRRLGVLLCGARADAGRSLDDVAARSGFRVEDIAALEAGDLLLTDAQLDAVLAGYGVSVEELLPARSQVVLDLDAGELVVADEHARLQGDAPTADEVLAAYLSLVYTLRHASPGTQVVLREHDIAVLSRSLHLAEPDVEARLHGLMANPTEDVDRLTRLLRHKLVLPIVGAVVVATALGTVLVLRADDSPSAPPAGVTTEVPPAELLPPVQQERNADGSVGPPVEVAP